MRLILDRFYGFCGLLACLSVLGILGSVMLQVIARFAEFTFDATELSGFFLAAASFLGLAYTFRAGAHIRMTALIHRATGTRKRNIELFCTALSAVSLAYFTCYAADMALDSFIIGDKSPGLMAVPFWIPQIPMVVGLAGLTVAFVDEFVEVLYGKDPNFKDVEQLEVEQALAVKVPGGADAPAPASLEPMR
jgi:TRAP-type C4-dicarboxylate transport system permease small subunit